MVNKNSAIEIPSAALGRLLLNLDTDPGLLEEEVVKFLVFNRRLEAVIVRGLGGEPYHRSSVLVSGDVP